MSQIHAIIRETQQATEDGYQAEKHAQLLGALAGLLAPHLNVLNDRDEIADQLAEALGTFAQGDMMRDKIQDALGDMSGSFTLSRY
jgi:hypothetical protein